MGKNWNSPTSPLFINKSLMSTPLPASQSHALWFQHVVQRRELSALNIAERTAPGWRSGWPNASPVSEFQSLAVRSQDVVARRLLSGLNVAVMTPRSWSNGGVTRFPDRASQTRAARPLAGRLHWPEKTRSSMVVT